MALTYISICDLSKPKGSKWVGGIYVECDDPEIAVMNSNPANDKYVRKEFRNRLLTTQELKETCAPGDEVVDFSGKVVA